MNKGFTLAEILITLGIIGILSVMTMPGLIAEYNKKQTAIKLKRLYSLISQAYVHSEADNGPSEHWISQSEGDVKAKTLSYVKQYWEPYLQVLNYCDDYISCGYKSPTPLSYKGNSMTWYMFGGERVSLYLNDGTYLLFRPMEWYTPDDNIPVLIFGKIQFIIADINGPKNPNTFGKDIFSFIVDTEKHRVIPYGLDFDSSDKKEKCINAPDYQSSCSALIMEDNWEIKY